MTVKRRWKCIYEILQRADKGTASNVVLMMRTVFEMQKTKGRRISNCYDGNVF